MVEFFVLSYNFRMANNDEERIEKSIAVETHIDPPPEPKKEEKKEK